MAHPTFEDHDLFLQHVEKTNRTGQAIYDLAMAQTLSMLRRCANDQLLTPDNPNRLKDGLTGSAWRNRVASKQELCRALASSLCLDDDPDRVISMDEDGAIAEGVEGEGGETVQAVTPPPAPKTDLAEVIANAVANLLPAQTGTMDEARIREIAKEIASDLDAQASDTIRDWTRDRMTEIEGAVLDKVGETITTTAKDFIGAKLDEAATAMAGQVAGLIESAKRTIKIEVGDRPVTQIEGDQHRQFPTLLNLLAAGLHVMLVGPAGSGKTHACESSAKALGLPFYSMSVGQQTTMSAIMGYMDANGRYVTTVFRRTFEGGGVFLLDELDAGNPNVLTALNAALANGLCAFPDGMVKQSPEFRCVAAANTYGNGQDRQYVGRNQLDATSLDRFASLPWSYDETLERAIAGFDLWVNLVQAYRAAADELKIRHIISPRASIQGARLCIQGAIPVMEIINLVVFKGLDKTTCQQIMNKAKARGIPNDFWTQIERAAKAIRATNEKSQSKITKLEHKAKKELDGFFEGVAVGE